MNKKELIAVVASRSGLSKGDATKAIDAFFEALTDALKRGEEVSISDFGRFSVRARAARTGRNPRTGEALEIMPTKRVAFMAGKELKLGLEGVPVTKP